MRFIARGIGASRGDDLGVKTATLFILFAATTGLREGGLFDLRSDEAAAVGAFSLGLCHRAPAHFSTVRVFTPNANTYRITNPADTSIRSANTSKQNNNQVIASASNCRRPSELSFLSETNYHG